MVCRWRSLLWCAGLGLVIPSTGCTLVPKSRLDACQAYSCELQRKNQEICAQYENLRLQNQDLANKSLDAEEKLAQQEELLARYEREMAGFRQDRDKMEAAYASLLDQSRSNPLPRDVRSRLEDFARQHPEFVEVDSELGIAKFRSDVLFASGQAELRPESQAVLSEFASIFQQGSGRPLKIMVVGHTDRTRIAKPETSAKHPTNWYLSAHRAIAVEEYLERAGIEPNRMGVVGYGQHQPIDPKDLAKNRRVEIFVLAPDAPIVGRVDASGQRY
jgi:chemotaxis protein MotB